MILLFATYLIILWAANAWHDSDYHNKKDAHISGAVLACVAVAGLFILNGLTIKTYDFNDIINLSFLALSFRWIVFDIAYNLMIGQKWYYKGTTSWIDRTLNYFYLFSLKAVCLFFDVPIIMSFFNR